VQNGLGFQVVRKLSGELDVFVTVDRLEGAVLEVILCGRSLVGRRRGGKLVFKRGGSVVKHGSKGEVFVGGGWESGRRQWL
jgi:hypothetical protein